MSVYISDNQDGRGRGVYVKGDFKSGEEVLRVATEYLVQVNGEKSCSWCLVDLSDDQTKRCGGGCKTRYCSENCQRLDWKKHRHKYLCNKLAMNGGDLADRVRALKTPSSRLALYCMMSPPEKFGALKVSGNASRSAYDELREIFGTDVPEQTIATAVSRIECNYYNVLTVNGPADVISVTGSMVNHACQPSTHVHYDRLRGDLVFYALRDIKNDEEVTHQYAPLDELSFECKCGGCDSPMPLMELVARKRELFEKLRASDQL